MQNEMTDIQRELMRISVAHGGLLTAESVVEAAGDENSPLHDSFTWDDSEAAVKWRLHQARNLILRVNVEAVGIGNQEITIRAWSSLTPDRENEGGGYRETIRLMKNKDHRAQLLADALDELNRITEKYNSLEELSGVFAAIRKVKR
jgi:hypothetical protein